MGYKKLIRSLIPDNWLAVLRQEGAITYYVNAVYRSFKDDTTVMKRGGGNNAYNRFAKENGYIKRSIIEVMTRCPFYGTLFSTKLTSEECDYWITIYKKIRKV